MLFLRKTRNTSTISYKSEEVSISELCNKRKLIGLLLLAVIHQSSAPAEAYGEPLNSCKQKILNQKLNGDDEELKQAQQEHQCNLTEFNIVLEEYVDTNKKQINDILTEGCELIIPGKFLSLEHLKLEYNFAVQNKQRELQEVLGAILEDYLRFCHASR